MTRINLVNPSELCRQHLIAEYRELPRIFGLVRKAVARGETVDSIQIPPEYCLGKGHCKFFYDKLAFLFIRYGQIVVEMRKRNYTVNYWFTRLYTDNNSIPKQWWNDYVPPPHSIALSRQRIQQRLQEM